MKQDSIMAGSSSCASNMSEELSSELEALASIYSADKEFSLRSPQESEKSDYLCVVNVKPSSMTTGLKLSIPGT